MKPPFVRLRIEVDDHVVADFAHPILMVAIGNGSRVGGGAEITPEADPERRQARRDGVVLHVAVGQGSGTPSGSAAARHHERDDVLYLRGASGSASPAQDFYCSADGELYGPERNRTWHVEPRRVLDAAARLTRRGSDPAAADRLDAGLEPRVGPELVEQLGHPASYGAHAEAERPGDLLVLGAAGELAEQQPLVAGPLVVRAGRPGRAPAIAFSHSPSNSSVSDADQRVAGGSPAGGRRAPRTAR